MTNTNLLKGAIRTAGYTQENFAETIGISSTSLSSKLNNKRQFCAEEIKAIINELHIDDVMPYFFA